MPRKHRHEEPATELPVVVPDPATEQEAADDAEIETQIALPNSVVKKAYKQKYRDRARENGHKDKAAKRSAWDWLAQELAAATLTKDRKLRVDVFLALLEANGVDHSRWQNRSKGWEGRLRMTGRLALQRVVAETGILRFPVSEEEAAEGAYGDGGDWKEAPAEWIAKFLN